MEKEIKNDLLITEGENLKVKIPSINCILGDKLTAFAPHTTGILLNTGKDMEVMKQMYDVHTLLNKFDDFDEMISTYNSIIDQEIAYRGTHIDRNDVLDDTYEGIAQVEVVLKVVKPETSNNKEAGIKVKPSSGGEFYASKICDSFEEAVDESLEALERQLVKYKEKQKKI